MHSGHCPCPRDGQSCKTKWHQILPDYKRIVDHHAKTGVNALEYWGRASHECIASGLLKPYPIELYESLHEWNGDRHDIIPPHVSNLLAPIDGNYRATNPPHDGLLDKENVEESRPDCEDPPHV
jgi:hypothetical protein